MHPLRVANNKFSKNLGKNFFRSKVPPCEQKKCFLSYLQKEQVLKSFTYRITNISRGTFKIAKKIGK